MLEIKTSHLVTGEELAPHEIQGLIQFAIELKKERKAGKNRPLLLGKHLAMIFDKPSLRTRFSFSVAMSELGGTAIESLSATRKQELPQDMARVLSGYCHGIMVRTHDDSIIEKMSTTSGSPVINGLSELHHPCQILADLMTLQEAFKDLKGLTLSYIGDGNNILHSLLLLAPLVGVNIQYSCPPGYRPHAEILKKAEKQAKVFETEITFLNSPQEAVRHAHAVYTDVWTSMGFEAEKDRREDSFSGFQVNEELMAQAEKNAVVMHCLPMERGKEISWQLPDSPSSVIFQQSENRLHIQKALLVGLMGRT